MNRLQTWKWIVALLLLCCACSNANDSKSNVVTKFVGTSGNFQSGFHGNLLNDLMIQAIDDSGQGIPGITMDFRLLAEEGMSTVRDIVLSSENVVTDNDGLARISLQLGQESGTAQIEVRDGDRRILYGNRSGQQHRTRSATTITHCGTGLEILY